MALPETVRQRPDGSTPNPRGNAEAAAARGRRGPGGPPQGPTERAVVGTQRRKALTWLILARRVFEAPSSSAVKSVDSS